MTGGGGIGRGVDRRGGRRGGLSIRVEVAKTGIPGPAVRINRGVVAELAGHVLAAENVERAEVSLVFCDDDRIAGLNRDWLAHQGPTDVIAFGFSEGGEDPEGEVYIDLAQAARQAPEFGASLDEEVRRLVVHGLLHLLGYDDLKTQDRRRMTARQEELVAGWSRSLLDGGTS
jgi:probable rRNA maturation factor